MTSEIENELAAPLGQYPYLKHAGNFVYLSGVSARLSDGKIAGVVMADKSVFLDVQTQTKTVLDKIQTIFRSIGATLSDCVEIIAFLTNMRDFELYNNVYEEYFDNLGPARTTVGVRELPHPHMVIEMRAVAFLQNNK